MENQEISKELLFSHFEGSASVRQRQLIDEWARKPENEEQFYWYLTEWEMAQPGLAVDVEQGMRRYRSRVELTNVVTEEEIGVPARHYWPRYIAACAVLLLISIGVLYRNDILYANLTTGPGQVRSWTLSDGSRVKLNASSELRLPRWGFGQTSREVSLKGEATFSITHQANNQRFIVKAGDGVNVTVLGTEFSVYSRPGKTEVILSKGKVTLQRREQKLVMKPGDSVIVENGTLSHNRFVGATHNTIQWESRFDFDRTSLSEVAHILEINYGLTVDFSSPELKSLTVSGSFQASNAQELIRSVSQILGIGYSFKASRVVFLSEPAER
ncbi:FecR family protein [Dyadobacter sp. SG02]|uniref:FecR family protein n=1 Tax=Dyadobacter sp. SG02 TaxID=1855291 RepID=UPI0008C895B0|nr:FecR domain-containing protein [Dyadobacter sp. SG02]SEJ75701.1 FecR family protein [Dyadobacter sp. SG02]